MADADLVLNETFGREISFRGQNRDMRAFESDVPLIEGIYLITLKEEEIIGALDLHFKPEDGAIEWSFKLKEDMRGKGFGSEAKRAVIEMIKSALGLGKEIDYFTDRNSLSQDLNIGAASLDKAFGLVDNISNYPSLSANLKAGAVIESVIDDHYVICSIGEGVVPDGAAESIVKLSKEFDSLTDQIISKPSPI